MAKDAVFYDPTTGLLEGSNVAIVPIGAPVVYDSGATASGNVYTDFALAVDACNAIDGPKTLFMRTAATVDAFTSSMKDISLVGNTALPSGSPLALTFTGASTIPAGELPVAITDVLVVNNSTATALFSVDSDVYWLKLYGTVIFDNDNSAFDFDIATGAGLVISSSDTVEFQGTGNIQLDGTAICRMFLTDGKVLNTTLAAPASGTPTAQIVGNGDAIIPADQATFTGGSGVYIPTWLGVPGVLAISASTVLTGYLGNLIVEVDTSTTAVTVTLPDPALSPPFNNGGAHRITVLDNTGDAWRFPITVDADGGANATHFGAFVINQALSSAEFVSSTANDMWLLVSETSFTNQRSLPSGIHQDNLAFFAMQNHINSYKGGGWFDLITGQAGNITGVALGSDGRFSFDGDGTDDIEWNGLNPSLTDIFVGGGQVFIWVRVDSDGENNRGALISNYTSGGAGGWTIDAGGATEGQIRLLTQHATTDGEWVIDDPLPLGVWKLIGVEHDTDSDTNNPTFSVDGVEVAHTETTSPSGAYSAGDDSLVIGDTLVSDAAFDGSLDMPMLYTKVFNTVELYDIFNSTRMFFSRLLDTGTLCFGADLSTVDNHPIVNGTSAATEVGSLNQATETVVPYDCIVRKLTWKSLSAGTSVIELFIDGTGTGKTWTLDGSSTGVLLMDSGDMHLCTQGRRLALRVTTVNTAPDAATFQVVMERYEQFGA